MRVRAHKYPDEGKYVDTTYYDPSKEWLDLGYQNLRSLPMIWDFRNIRSLLIDFNNLVQLPEMPSLEHLSCQHNKLITIPFYPNLKHANLSENCITKLPSSYSSSKLEWLDISKNNFRLTTSLPHCASLFASSNDLSTFDLSLIPKIRYLDLSENRLVSLDSHNGLIELHISKNHLSKINNYPNLKHLDASYNRLTHINLLPKIEALTIDHNLLTDIDQPNLTSLIANHNKIQSYESSGRLTYLDLSQNCINSLVLGDKIESAFVQDNRIQQIVGRGRCLEEITLDYDCYRLIYERIKERVLHLESVVMTNRLETMMRFNTKIELKALSMFESCKLGRHQETLTKISELLKLDFNQIKDYYYRSLLLVIRFKSS